MSQSSGRRHHQGHYRSRAGQGGRAGQDHQQRQGPKDSATQYPLGTQKRGLDGGIWEIVQNKNGVQRWQRISVRPAANAEVFDNSVVSEKLIRAAASPFIAPDLIATGIRWAAQLKPVAQELAQHGILLFIFPMGYYYTDVVRSNTVQYIRNTAKIQKFFKQRKMIQRVSSDGKVETVPQYEFLYYLAEPPTATSIYLTHFLSSPKVRRTVADVLRKHKINFRWNMSERSTIQIIKPGARPERVKSFEVMLVDKIRRDVKLATGRRPQLRMLQRGRERGPEGDPHAPTIIELGRDFDVALLDRLLRSYGLKRFSPVRGLTVFDVHPDQFIIKDNKLYIYFSLGISPGLHDILAR